MEKDKKSLNAILESYQSIEMKIIECVPNFSEGRNLDAINQITDAIKSISGITILDVNIGADTNRTVVTFVGSPIDVIDAAFKGIQKPLKAFTFKGIQKRLNIRGSINR